MALTPISISTQTENWNFEEFLTFVLIYVSYADLEFCEIEKEAIIRRVGQDTFDRVNNHFHTLGEFQRLNFILHFKTRFYSDKKSKEELLSLILTHFKQDGEVSKLESNLLDFLSRLF